MKVQKVEAMESLTQSTIKAKTGVYLNEMNNLLSQLRPEGSDAAILWILEQIATCLGSTERRLIRLNSIQSFYVQPRVQLSKTKH